MGMKINGQPEKGKSPEALAAAQDAWLAVLAKAEAATEEAKQAWAGMLKAKESEK
jgi:hypothetical protein